MEEQKSSTEQQQCIVCGMPLNVDGDRPEGKPDADYCQHCGTKEGLYTYDQLVEGMADYILGFNEDKGETITIEDAKAQAITAIDNSPAMQQGRLTKTGSTE